MKYKLFAAAAFAATSVLAVDKYYLAATENSDSAATGFLNASAWGKGKPSGAASDVFDATADYIFRSSQLRLRVVGSTDKTFQGGCLVIGDGGSHGALCLTTATSPAVTTFGNRGLKIVRGCIHCIPGSDNATYLTAGPISVAQSANAGGYAGISFDNNGTILRHAGALSVAAGDTLIVGNYNNGFCTVVRTGNTLEVAGDCSGVNGTLRVNSPTAQANGTATASYDTTLALGSTSVPGKVYVGKNCRLKTIDGTNELSIADLAFAENTWLSVPYDAENRAFGSIRVTGALAISNKVTIAAPNSVPHVAKAAVLTAPKSSGVTARNFTIASVMANPYRSLSVEEVGDDIVVYLVYSRVPAPVYPTIYQTFLGSAEAWTDELAAHSGADYVISGGSVTNSSYSYARIFMPTNGADYTFPGDSLTISDDSRFIWNWQGNTVPVFNCQMLRLMNGAYLWGEQKAHIRIAGGKVAALSGTVYMCGANGRNVIIDSEIVGNAEVMLWGYGSSSGEPFARYLFRGSNTNFFGSITVRQKDDSASGNNYSARYNTLAITKAIALGGDLPERTPKALTLARYAQLSVEGTTTLAEASNRGIFVEDYGRIAVSGGNVFRVETPLAINGTFWKEGVGTLELAGPMAFGSEGTAAAPEADANNFIVTGGVVRVCSADAINGAAVEFQRGSSMELAVDFDDADLVAYGIRNVKTDTPFVLAAGLDKMPLLLNVDGVVPPERPFTLNYLTVTRTAADENGVRAMLPTFAKPFRGYHMTPVETSNAEAGTVTFGLAFSPTGLTIIFR